jgi:phosphatidyl-myo-inositol alpha-mannosyltransferase
VDPSSPAPSPARAIALVCPYSLSRPGGVQGQVVGLARALGARGHRATVFAPLDAVTDAPPGIDLVVTGRPVSLPANGSVAPVALSVRAVVQALRALRTGGFDVVHVHEPFAPGLPFGLLVDRRLPPLVATFHRSGPSPFYRVLQPLTRPLMRRFAVCCAVSPAARATAVHALGGRYEVGFNGIEMDRFLHVEPWPRPGPTILFLGRHEERKGLAVLLEAFDRLRLRRGIDAGADATGSAPTLWVAGDGPRTEALRQRHPEAADLHWLGVLTEEEKVRRLVAADVVAAPSLGGESFGMVLVEAMAARAVVVASDIDGYREAAGGHAVLFPPGDAPALVDALAGVLGLSGGPADHNRDGAAPAGGGPGSPTWLDDAWAWASHWSMGRLAEWYEARYDAAVVRTGP